MQGLEGAKAYQVNTSNAEVYLRDSDDSDILYIKTTDQYGRPNTLRMFRLTEEEIQDSPFPDASKYVTVDQLNDILDDKFDQLVKKLNRPQNQSGGKRNNGSKRNNRRYEEDEYDDEAE